MSPHRIRTYNLRQVLIIEWLILIGVNLDIPYFRPRLTFSMNYCISIGHLLLILLLERIGLSSHINVNLSNQSNKH